MNPSVQWMTLLYMMLAGTAMGFTYDSYRVLSLRLHFPRWLSGALDFLYWVWAALLTFRMLYAGNQGQLRFYVFVGLFLGVWFYFLLFSVTVRRFVVMLIQSVQYMLRLLWKVTGVLIGMPLLWLWRLLGGVLRLLWRILLFVLKLLLRLTKPIWWFPAKWFSPYWAKLAHSAWVSKVKAGMSRLRKR
ncbi:spore cortex biosynthesis protein YabQ [Paenibacillus tengchongensis]|uniref:spore cortex biosynthesis protein YabQ n=1 Tax=Paenibacillus tengchongensis TaxID=2608684 RepID=UPI00124D1475|nr:spore cortex biosynthesis protein YabQ [Paenibacillus tengchongensis]